MDGGLPYLAVSKWRTIADSLGQCRTLSRFTAAIDPLSYVCARYLGLEAADTLGHSGDTPAFSGLSFQHRANTFEHLRTVRTLTDTVRDTFRALTGMLRYLGGILCQNWPSAAGAAYLLFQFGTNKPIRFTIVKELHDSARSYYTTHTYERLCFDNVCAPNLYIFT